MQRVGGQGVVCRGGDGRGMRIFFWNAPAEKNFECASNQQDVYPRVGLALF